MVQLKYTLDNLSETARKILQTAEHKTLLFYADMGVGKTTLIKELVKQLGSTDVVTSPTFSLVNEYAAKNGSVFHFDFYRIEDEIEAMDIGIEEYFDQDTWLFIEWPGKIKNLLPDDCQEIHLERKDGYNILRY